MNKFNVGDEVVIGGCGNTSKVKFGRIIDVRPPKYAGQTCQYRCLVVTVNFNTGQPVFSTGKIIEPEYQLQHMAHGLFQKLGL